MKIFETKTAPNPRRVRMFMSEKGLLDKAEFVEIDLQKGENALLGGVQNPNDALGQLAWFTFFVTALAAVAVSLDSFVAERDSGRLLGVQAVTGEAGELIHELAAVMYYHGNVRDLLQIPHYHPTLAEILTYPAEELAEQL